MIEKVLEPVVNAGSQLLLKAGGVLAKESVKQGAKIGGRIMTYAITIIMTYMLTTKWDKKVFANFLKKHDKEMAEKLKEEFESEMDKLKEEIASLKLDKEETKKRFREGVITLCEKYGIDPNEILK